jgi:hypothetical protein
MDDVDVAAHISELDSLSTWIYSEYEKSLEGAITVGKPVVTKNIQAAFETGEGYILLTNNTDKDIAGKDYQIRWKYIYLGGMADSTNYANVDGKDIAAHKSVKIPYQFSGHAYMEISSVKMKEMSMDEYLASYQPTGDEYDNFKKAQ